MNIFYAITISLLAGLSTVIGGLFIYVKVKKNNIDKFIVFCLSFSIAIMIGISIFDLLPSSIFTIYGKYKLWSLFILFILFLFSFLLIKIFNKLTNKYESNLYKLGIISMIALILHNLPEGIITFLSSVNNPSLGIKLSIAIALHNIPEGICIAVPIYYATGSKRKAITKTLLSGLSEPLGAILAYLIIGQYITNLVLSYILVIVAGIMITLSIEQIFPESLKYNQKKYIIYGILFGIIIFFLTFLI